MPSDSSIEKRILDAIRTWPNHPWLVLPGPTDISGSLAVHLVKELGLTEEWFARHVSGGGAGGFKSQKEAQIHIDEHPPRPGGVDDPPDRGYVGVEHRWVTQWSAPRRELDKRAAEAGKQAGWTFASNIQSFAKKTEEDWNA
jgi:hypothetical protein